MCTPSTSYIDTEVKCSRVADYAPLICTAERARHTRGRPIDANTTVLSFKGNLELLSLIPRLLPDPEGGRNNLLNLFLRDPTLARPMSAFYEYTEFVGPPPLDNVPMEIFEARLAAVFNTVIRASYEQSIIVGSDGLSPSTESFSVNAADRDISVTPLSTWDNGTGTWAEFTEPAYEVDVLWMVIYAVSTLVMTVFAVGHVVLQVRVKSPDFLTSISALTRDSPFVAVPEGASGLGGPERARLLRHKRVRIQDVQPEGDVGRIAFGDDSLGVSLYADRRYL